MKTAAPRRRVVLGAVVAAVVLAAGSTAAIAAMTGAFRTSSKSPDGRCTASSLPGTVVDVALMNMGGPMMGRGQMTGAMGGTMRVRANHTEVPSGTVSFRVANVGSIVHELVVLPLAEAQRVGDRQVRADGTIDETDSVGEASRSCGSGSGDGIRPGSLGWTTLHLQPGEYELVCNLPGHYASGMYTRLRVT